MRLPTTRMPCSRAAQDEAEPTKGLWGVVKHMYNAGDQKFKKNVREALGEHRQFEDPKVAPLPGCEPTSDDDDDDDQYRDF